MMQQMRAMRDWLGKILPHLLALGFVPIAWRLPVYAALGVLGGIGLLLVRVSEAQSYLSDNPRTCINCHIMVPEYATWKRSSHARFTNCNSCHVPHDNVVNKYVFKAKDGLRHSAIFTLRAELQVIRAKPEARRVINENCRHCHAQQVSGAFLLVESERKCVDCHRSVPHGDVHSLASTPNVRYPHLPPLLPLHGDTPR